MRCLHCGKRLTIIRKLSDHEFCSEAHRAAFGREHEQLALSRLIDAQQQSQTVHRRWEKEKKKAPEAPGIELTSESLSLFVEHMPPAREPGWQGCRNEDSELLLRSPDVWVPRMNTASRTGRIPVGGSVRCDIRVEALGGAAMLVAVAAEAEWHGRPKTLAELTAWSGNADACTSAIRPDFRRTVAVEPRRAPVPDLQVPEAGVLAWPDAVKARNWVAAARQVNARPVLPRYGSTPEAFPRAALRVVEAEAETVSGPEVRAGADSMMPLAAPAPRREPARWRTPLPVEEWSPVKALPRHGVIAAARMPMLGCRRLSLERLACGSYRKIEVREGPLPFPGGWVLPRQGRPHTGWLLLAGRVPIVVPQPDWGRQMTEAGCGPEPSPAFLVPPRCGNLPSVEFEPPFYGMRQLRLSVRSDHDPEKWRRHQVDGPFVPVAVVGARPNFSAPLLCDWVPVRARMMELKVEIAPRSMAALTADAVPACEFPPPAVPGSQIPALTLPLRGNAGVKGRATGLRRIALDSTVPHQSARDPKALLDDEALTVAPVLPKTKLRPAKDRPTLDIERRLRAPGWKKSLYRAADVWDGVSGFTKVSGALMAILLVVFAAAPGVGQSGGGGGGSVQRTLAGGWEGIQRNILNRAAVALTDDFRAGLADWEGEGDWARAWSYDQSGFVRTGPLALYTPSLGLTNYRMEFLGQIEKRSLGWMVRAADRNNYYAVKLVVAEAGPVPEVLIQRYAVIDGRPGPVKQKRLPVQVRMDTLYRVKMEVRDNDYSLSVQDAVVDTWSEPALRRGGIGFFSGKGELARLRWVGVWHQYDTLGRLCALLAPQGIADRERGASQ